MTTTEIEKDEHFREAVRRLEEARALPSQKARRAEREVTAKLLGLAEAVWPAPGFEDTKLGVLIEPEVDHGEAEVYAGVQA